jgi:hypothetical protein
MKTLVDREFFAPPVIREQAWTNRPAGAVMIVSTLAQIQISRRQFEER